MVQPCELLEKVPISRDSGDKHGGSWTHFFSWKTLQCHFEPQFFGGVAAPLPGAARPPAGATTWLLAKKAIPASSDSENPYLLKNTSNCANFSEPDPVGAGAVPALCVL